MFEYVSRTIGSKIRAVSDMQQQILMRHVLLVRSETRSIMVISVKLTSTLRLYLSYSKEMRTSESVARL